MVFQMQGLLSTLASVQGEKHAMGSLTQGSHPWKDSWSLDKIFGTLKCMDEIYIINMCCLKFGSAYLSSPNYLTQLLFMLSQQEIQIHGRSKCGFPNCSIGWWCLYYTTGLNAESKEKYLLQLKSNKTYAMFLLICATQIILSLPDCILFHHCW